MSDTVVNFSAILQPVLDVAGIVVAGLLVRYVPRGIDLFERVSGVQLTDQQRAVVLGAAKTAAGVLETRLDQGVINASHITVNNPEVRAQALAMINVIPDDMAKLGVTEEGAARIIVGMVDTAAHGAPPPSAPITAVVEAAPKPPLVTKASS